MIIQQNNITYDLKLELVLCFNTASNLPFVCSARITIYEKSKCFEITNSTAMGTPFMAEESQSAIFSRGNWPTSLLLNMAEIRIGNRNKIS